MMFGHWLKFSTTLTIDQSDKTTSELFWGVLLGAARKVIVLWDGFTEKLFPILDYRARHIVGGAW